ncbi:Exocyst complex component 4 [Lambiella insularis]|nr:Exocyst complex component 4 [Lambiella insularis]
MSYGRNGMNGYGNGYRNPEQSNRNEEDPANGGLVGGQRVRRAGGYGGYVPGNMSEQPELGQTDQHGPESPDPFNAPRVPGWRRAEGRGQGRDDGGSRDRSRAMVNGSHLYGDGPAGKQIEGVIDHIQEKWSMITKNDCVPVHVALQLMDYSSLGRGNDYEDFRQTSRALQKALKAIVNGIYGTIKRWFWLLTIKEHHQGFNSSIGTFHKIQASIQTSQSRVRALKDSLIQAKMNLTVAKPELKGLATSSQSYDEMLQILGQIEKLQTMPEQLDARISEKHFLSAVDVLQDALRMIRNSTLENIGALADLRIYLNNQDTSLADILLEELHDHLYLKSPYCSDRWTVYSYRTDRLTDAENAVSMSTGLRPLYRFLTSLNTLSLMVDDPTKNPETDSFGYIQMILEALNKMGRLDLAVNRMEQRLPIELFAVVERTNQEVDLRHPAHLRENANLGRIKDIDLLGDHGEEAEVLRDLLFTLYSKFEAIAEGHRAVHEVIAGIVGREGLRKPESLLGGFKELWKLYQSEMRSFLHDYLATDGNPLYSTKRMSDINANIFQRTQRDKTKRVFRLGELDESISIMSNDQADLDKILQASVPGLVSKSHRRSATIHGDRGVSCDRPAVGHKLLLEPSVFNISLLLPPSLSFLQTLKDIVPPDSDIAISTLTSFLDDFLVNVFNPQLDETLTELCSQLFVDLDAFEQDSRWADHALRPIFKGTSLFASLVKRVCRMLDNIPHDKAFTQLIVTQLVTYHDKCATWYRGLVTRARAEGGTCLKTAAAVVETGDLSVIVKTIWKGDETDRERLIEKEAELLISRTNQSPLEPFDIISDRRTVTALCLLYSSMKWLEDQLSQLRHMVDKDPTATQESNTRRRRWTLLGTANMQDGDQPVYLPMNKDTVRSFDDVLAAYRELATTALLTLHVDIRCGMIHMISRVVKAPYSLDQPANEPDSGILALNADLLSFDDNLTVHLPNKEYNFITSGLGILLDNILVTNASQINVMNMNGCERMQLNILVLQQNLKSIESGVVLGRSAQFFENFTRGADAIIEQAKATGGKDLGFSLEELKVLVELCYSEALQSQQRDIAAQARKALSDHQLQLSESMWNS